MSSIPERKTRIGATAAVTAGAVYLGVCVAANVLTARYGLVPIGFGLAATAGTYAAGAALLVRDVVQDAAGKRIVVALVLGAAILSAWLSTPQLAFASGAAFLVAELLDLAVYTPLRRHGWARAVVASQVVGAVADTFLFLWLAGFPITGQIVAGQLLGKGYALLIVAVALLARGVRRAVLRQSVHAAGA